MTSNKRLSIVTSTVTGDVVQHAMLPEVVHSFGFNDTNNDGLLDFDEFKDFLAQVGILRVIKSKLHHLLAENAFSFTYELGISNIVLEDHDKSVLNKNSNGNITRRRGSMIDHISFLDLKAVHEIEGVTIAFVGLIFEVDEEKVLIFFPGVVELEVG